MEGSSEHLQWKWRESSDIASVKMHSRGWKVMIKQSQLLYGSNWFNLIFVEIVTIVEPLTWKSGDFISISVSVLWLEDCFCKVWSSKRHPF